MRGMIAMAAAAALVGAAPSASTPAFAADGGVAAIAPPSLLRPVQFYGDDWERRHRREWRRERDERRIEESARREAWRIEREREERRAWRRAVRGQHGYGYGPVYGYVGHRSW